MRAGESEAVPFKLSITVFPYGGKTYAYIIPVSWSILVIRIFAIGIPKA